MAGVWKRHNSKNYAAVFRDKNGIRRCVSTGTSNRREARKIADTYEAAARTKRTLLQTQKVIERLHEEMTGETISRVTIRSRVVDWLATKKPEIASASLAFYQNSLGKLLDFLGPKADAPLSEVTKADIIAFRNRLLTQVSAKTANHDLRAVKTLFKSAREDDVIVEDPAASVKRAQSKTMLATKRSFTLDELRAVLDVADPEWKSMILFGLYTGQRLADVATVRWGNVDLVRGEIRLTTRKTDKVMILPIAAPLRRYLEGLPSTDDLSTPLHPRAFAVVERQGKSGGLSRQFIDLLADAGIREKQAHRSRGIGRSAQRQAAGLSFHSLRRTATTLLHEAGVPAAVVQSLIGHDSEEVHQLYVAVGKEALASAAARLPDLV
ncbi:MAG: site-specific integrase [Chthoniobacterales bacterium]